MKPVGVIVLATICTAFLAVSLTAADAPPRLELKPADTVVFAGGTNMFNAQRHGHLETLLTLRFAEAKPKFRNMAWQADTVYRQQRPLNFAPWPDQLKRVNATVIVAWFGQSESLDGPDALPAFIDAYGKLLDTFAAQTPRIILMSPTPFEPAEPPLPDLSKRNDDVKRYVDAIAQLAAQRGYVYVDLFNLPADVRRTDNGLHLTERGHAAVAEAAAAQLGLKPAPWSSLADLRTAIVDKNRLWFNYWRPTNWAFLYGDRDHVMFSRDHRDPNIRSFLAEMDRFPPLIEQAEQRVHALARDAADNE